MAYIRAIDSTLYALAGENNAETRTARHDVRPDAWQIDTATGQTVRGNARYGVPGAAVQRRAMALADVTGATVTMSRGEHFSPMYASGTTTWGVIPAAHSQHTEHARGWLVTVSSPDGIIGYRHARHYFSNWPAVVAFLAHHFPHDTVTVTDDETIAEVNGTLLDGFGETVGDTDTGAGIWAGIVQVGDAHAAPWYGREQNTYGQHTTYRFANREQAQSWLESVETGPADLY